MALPPDPDSQSARPEQRRHATLAVLFADVVGSTRLYDTLGDTRAKELVDECIAVLRTVVVRHGGCVIKTLGDEVMCVFPNADRACLAAMDMQLGIDALPALAGVQRSIRIGLHLGPVIEEDGDVFGDAVNLAGRMVGLATAMQIITTRATVEQLSRVLQFTTRRIAAMAVKGKGDDVEICEIIWQTGDDLTMSTPSIIAAPRQSSLQLRYGPTALLMEQTPSSIVLGRDATCQIVVLDRRASRQHARIERRRNKFFLIDQSTNGTFVTFADKGEIVLRREELMLRGFGRIAFCSNASVGGADDGASIEFLLRD
ncbi:MAG: adenylate/guanylate cyclase domain-containing protein [Rhodoferax sp.]